MRTLSIFVVLLATVAVAKAEETAPSRIDSITKSARDMMPAMPSVSLPSMSDLSLPDFSDATGRLMTEFNTFTQQVGDALPILEQMGYEVTTFKVTWGLPPKARLRLKSNGNADIQKVNASCQSDEWRRARHGTHNQRSDREAHSEHHEARHRLPRRGLRCPASGQYEVREPQG
jgi:hypothetical protein